VNREQIVAVFGSSQVPEGSADFAAAERLGRLLAEAGWVVMNGGYGGTMAALSRGAARAGGRVIGVTLAAFDRWPLCVNPWLSEQRQAPDLFTRHRWLIAEADAIVVLPGGVGTLAELFVAWNLLQIGSLAPRPVIVVGQAWQRALETLAAHLHVRPKDLAMLQVVDTVEAAVRLLRKKL